MQFKTLATACVSAMILAGCGTAPVADGEDTEGFAKRLISEKAAIAAAAQRDFAALQAEDYSTVTRRQAKFDQDVISMDFIGAPRELVQTIASRYGYSFNEIGRPIDLRPVNIRVKAVTPEEILRNVGNQIDAGGDILLNRESKTITLQYKQRDAQAVSIPGAGIIEPQAVTPTNRVADQKGG